MNLFITSSSSFDAASNHGDPPKVQFTFIQNASPHLPSIPGTPGSGLLYLVSFIKPRNYHSLSVEGVLFMKASLEEANLTPKPQLQGVGASKDLEDG